MTNASQAVPLVLVAVIFTGGVLGCRESTDSPGGNAGVPGPPDSTMPVPPPADPDLPPLGEPQGAVSAPAKSVTQAAIEGDVEALQMHIAAKSDLNQRALDSGATALIAATTFGQNETAILLIEGGADLEVRNNEGATALITAAFLCREKIVRALLENGADTTARNNVGSTALDSVQGPFDQVRPIYDILQQILGPVGLRLDYEFIEKTRPKMAEILRGQ